MTRLPYELRSFNSFSGDTWELLIPPDSALSNGAELGVVIGKKAR